MPDLTAKQLSRQYVGKRGTWAIHRAGGTINIPIEIVDAKTTYGRIRLLARIMGTDQETWLDTSSTTLERSTTP